MVEGEEEVVIGRERNGETELDLREGGRVGRREGGGGKEG